MIWLIAAGYVVVWIAAVLGIYRPNEQSDLSDLGTAIIIALFWPVLLLALPL